MAASIASQMQGPRVAGRGLSRLSKINRRSPDNCRSGMRERPAGLQWRQRYPRRVPKLTYQEAFS